MIQKVITKIGCGVFSSEVAQSEEKVTLPVELGLGLGLGLSPGLLPCMYVNVERNRVGEA